MIMKTQYSSVDFTGWYHDQFNLKKYLICLFHLIMLCSCLFLGFLFIQIDWLFHLVDNDFLPKNSKLLLLTGLIILVLTIAIRFDVFMGEWTRIILVYRYFYYLEHDIRSKHGLTKYSYKKLSTLARITELIILKGSLPLIGFLLIGLILLFTIISGKIVLQIIICPILIYNILIVIFTFTLAGAISIISIYYFKLLFDQINDQIEKMYKRSNLQGFIRFNDKKRLILMVKNHESISILVYKSNLMIRRCVCILFITLAFMQIIPLNLFIETDVWYEQILYLIYLSTSLSYGLGVSLLFSIQINSAHKPWKTIYKILKLKHKFNFYFEWKVTMIDLYLLRFAFIIICIFYNLSIKIFRCKISLSI